MKPWILKVFRARTSPEAIDLVSRLLEYTPSARITPLQVLFHIIATNSWRYWKFNLRRARTHSSTNCASRAPSCQAAGSSPFSSTSPNRWGEMESKRWTFEILSSLNLQLIELIFSGTENSAFPQFSTCPSSSSGLTICSCCWWSLMFRCLYLGSFNFNLKCMVLKTFAKGASESATETPAAPAPEADKQVGLPSLDWILD